jgi:hypothetical protein
MRVRCNIRLQPHYRRDAFIAGLKRCGHQVSEGFLGPITENDALVIWNRYGQNDRLAKEYEAAGGKVIICENGYMGLDNENRQYYSMALNGHNGSGRWYIGGPERWDKLGIEIKPWRSFGDHILVRSQRGIGNSIMASPPGWHNTVVSNLRRITDRPIRVRTHPGNNPKGVGLINDLNNCWCVIIWASSLGGRSLVKGYPVIYQAPYHVCSDAMDSDLESVNNPTLNDDRLFALRRMAWAQWSVDEISSGLPFKLLLGDL